ncbi:MAG TPA: universal stress protein [Longimicrobium sp.]|nr:universal stress protein [Longimicrobium sp.]
MRSILAVSDLAPASDGALSAAAGLAARTGAELHVVHAMGIVGMPLREALRTDVGRRIEDAESALAQQLRRAVPGGLVLAGRAIDFHGVRDTVPCRARETEADLVVFGAADPRTPEGTRHLHPLHEIAGVAAVPCLLVRDSLVHPPVRVLLPLSAAEIGEGVLAGACDWLASLDPPVPTELHVLHVASGAREWRDAAPDLDREVRWARDQRRWSERLRIRRTIRRNAVAHVEILRVAAAEAPDLVLLGPGCGAANSPELPEDARAVLLRCLPCSVLVLPRTHPRRADEDEAGAPASPTDPETPAREAPEQAERMELAAAGD